MNGTTTSPPQPAAAPTSPATLDPLRFPLQGSRLIEASAGTGKTFTIATLYVRLVQGRTWPWLHRPTSLHRPTRRPPTPTDRFVARRVGLLQAPPPQGPPV